MSQDKEREAFEAWVNKQPEAQGMRKRWWCRQIDDGGYSCHEPDVMWRAWQARAALASQQAGKGEPVAWQWRKKGDDWTIGKTFDHVVHATTDDTEVRTLYTAPQPAVQRAPARPDILERLSYHALERDDLTLDECLDYLAKGWAKVHGRTERQMVMQILALLAGQTASPPSREPLTDEQIRKWWGSENGLEDMDMCNAADFRKVVRAVEARLGIHSREGGSNG